AVTGQLGEVAAELVEHRRAGGCLLAGLLIRRRRIGRKQAHDMGSNGAGVEAEAGQQSEGGSVLRPRQTKQKMLGSDEVVPQPQRLPQGQLEHVLGAWGEGYGAR